MHRTNYKGFDYYLGSIIENATLKNWFVPSAFNSVVPGGWSTGTKVIFMPFSQLFLGTVLG